MEMKTFNNNRITFKYPVSWENEKPDTINNPDCIATLTKGEENLLNVVMFPTQTNLDDFKITMEDMIVDDGGVISESDFVTIAGKDAIRVVAEINTTDIIFEIYSYVFIIDRYIYIFELRTVDPKKETLDEYKELVDSFEVL